MAVLSFRGDLRRLSCDAWYLPGDFKPYIAPYWLKGDPELAAAVSQAGSRLPSGWGEHGIRVLPLPLADGRRAVPVLAAIPLRGTDDWNYHRETLRQFVDVAPSLKRPEHLQDRPRRLLAVPLIGTGFSTWQSDRARLLQGLLQALTQESERAGVDIVLVAYSQSDFSAVQATRRRLLAERGMDPDLPGTPAEAERLAELARRGRLVLFTGAGVGRPAGLPDWRGLLKQLASWAGLNEHLAARLSNMDLLDQAAIIVGRKGASDLADKVAELLDVPHHSLAHGLLANLPVRENVTLNYDQLFELAAGATGRPLAVLPYEPAQDRWLLKLHGCTAPDRRGDIVLTREDYLSLGQHRATLTGLVQALLVTRHMLFVGFGLADDHLHAVVHDVRRALGPTRTGKLGTALLLEHDELQVELWQQDLGYVAMGGSAEEAARRLELFLDHLLLLSTTSDAHLFDPLYDGLLTADERRLRDVLTAAFRDQPTGDAPAWGRVRLLLQELGWRR